MPEQRQSILMVVVGRQSVGKITVVNTIIQKVREADGQLRIWTAGVNSTFHSPGMIHDDVPVPSSAVSGNGEIRLEQRLEDQMPARHDAMLDVGGGDTPFERLVQGLLFVEFANPGDGALLPSGRALRRLSCGAARPSARARAK